MVDQFMARVQLASSLKSLAFRDSRSVCHCGGVSATVSKPAVLLGGVHAELLLQFLALQLSSRGSI